MSGRLVAAVADEKLKAELAALRHGREWPFAVGDQVRARGDWGSFVDLLQIYTDRSPDAVLTVHEVGSGGQWLSLRDEMGRVYDGANSRPCYGPSYFRIAGECGDHFPGYRNLEWRTKPTGGEYACLRCDEIMPALTLMLKEIQGGEEIHRG